MRIHMYLVFCLLLWNVQGRLRKLGRRHGKLISDTVKCTGKAIVNPFIAKNNGAKCRIASISRKQDLDRYVGFFLCNKNVERRTRQKCIQLYVDNIPQIAIENIIPGAEIKVIIHGFGGNDKNTPIGHLFKPYFDVNFNVITVDYSYYASAKKGCYRQAMKSVEAVAFHFDKLITKILSFQPTLFPMIHLIGFNIGVYVAGHMGLLKNKENLKYGRITALDPARPLSKLFYTLTPYANFVDVLHTNRYLHGKAGCMGTVDFIANNGTFQPGCRRRDSTCCHKKAVEYFAYSIKVGAPNTGEAKRHGIWAAECKTYFKFRCEKTRGEDLVIFGEYVPYGLSGLYYFITQPNDPYGQGMKTYKELSRKSPFWFINVLRGLNKRKRYG